MSDWRECELERIGGTILGRVGAAEDEATALVGEWVVRWGWGNGVRVAKKWSGIEPGRDSFSYDFWGSAVAASAPNAATGDDVQRLLAELDEARS